MHGLNLLNILSGHAILLLGADSKERKLLSIHEIIKHQFLALSSNVEKCKHERKQHREKLAPYTPPHVIALLVWWHYVCNIIMGSTEYSWNLTLSIFCNECITEFLILLFHAYMHLSYDAGKKNFHFDGLVFLCFCNWMQTMILKCKVFIQTKFS